MKLQIYVEKEQNILKKKMKQKKWRKKYKKKNMNFVISIKNKKMKYIKQRNKVKSTKIFRDPPSIYGNSFFLV